MTEASRQLLNAFREAALATDAQLAFSRTFRALLNRSTISPALPLIEEITGIPYRVLQDYYFGCTYPTMDHVEKLAAMLYVSPEDLMRPLQTHDRKGPMLPVDVRRPQGLVKTDVVTMDHWTQEQKDAQTAVYNACHEMERSERLLQQYEKRFLRIRDALKVRSFDGSKCQAIWKILGEMDINPDSVHCWEKYGHKEQEVVQYDMFPKVCALIDQMLNYGIYKPKEGPFVSKLTSEGYFEPMMRAADAT